MLQYCTKVAAVICTTLRIPNPKKNMILFSQVLAFAWYFAAFLVRTPYTAADTLTAGQFAPEAGFLGRVLPISTYVLKNPKKLLKNRVPENALVHS